MHDDKVKSDTSPENFPSAGSISGAMMFRLLPKPTGPRERPEFVYVRIPPGRRQWEIEGAIGEWNLAWEAGSMRGQMDICGSLPHRLAWLSDLQGVDVRLIPWSGKTRYRGHALLYHLLSARTLSRFGLPTFRRGIWPPLMILREDDYLPADTDRRLSTAFAHHIWRHLNPGSGLHAFAEPEPIRLLAHNLDFWMPYADRIALQRCIDLGPVAIDDEEQLTDIAELRETAPDGWTVDRPCFGTEFWIGEAEAQEATRELVEAADAQGRLRAIIDTVRSHRVEDDFSSRWSFAREDFERKLYRKRSKARVTFVELDDTIPIHGPDVEVDADRLWQSFLALLSPKDRRIVVCLRSGITRAVEISEALGYANHSPVSKALARIRRTAERYLLN